MTSKSNVENIPGYLEEATDKLLRIHAGVLGLTKIRVVDFFSGCGGTSAGLKSAGMDIIAGIDFNSDAGETFKHNFPEAEFLNKDITKLFSPSLNHLIPRDRNFPLLFSACAPCQPFTSQNTTPKKFDNRHGLLSNLNRFIRKYTPEYVFIENVPGMQKISKGSPFATFLTFLDRHGYSYEVNIIKSQDYGVPQHRKRLVLIASNLDHINFPEITHGPGTENRYKTVWDSISDLPKLLAGETHPEVENHRAAQLSETNLRRIKATPVGGSRNNWPKHLVLECHKKYIGHSDVYGRMLKDKPASGLTTRCISLSNGRYGHPTQHRAISLREAARLQTFPDNFIFKGSLHSMAKQIGNAVPVDLAAKFGDSFCKHFHQVSRKSAA